MEHKLIQGGEQYLPFARSRIKALRAVGLPYASQRYTMPDGEVAVRIAPGQEYIHLTGYSAIVLSGVTRVGSIISIPATDTTEAFDVLRSYKPTQQAWKFPLKSDPSKSPSAFNDEKLLAIEAHADIGVSGSQYQDVCSSMYSGLMAQAVQVVLGLGKTKGAPDGVQLRYNFRHAQCHVIVTDSEGGLWLTEISAANGVIAMPLPIIKGSKGVGATQDVLRECKAKFKGIPSGGTFPADIDEAITQGGVIRLATASDLDTFYSKSAYSPSMGWTINMGGTEAHNTCYTDVAGVVTGYHYKLEIFITAATDDQPDPSGAATLMEVESGDLIGQSRFRFWDGTSGQLLPTPTRPWPDDLYTEYPLTTATIFVAYTSGDVLEVIKHCARAIAGVADEIEVVDIVGDFTGPGDPYSNPFTWVRNHVDTYTRKDSYISGGSFEGKAYIKKRRDDYFNVTEWYRHCADPSYPDNPVYAFPKWDYTQDYSFSPPTTGCFAFGCRDGFVLGPFKDTPTVAHSPGGWKYWTYSSGAFTLPQSVLIGTVADVGGDVGSTVFPTLPDPYSFAEPSLVDDLTNQIALVSRHFPTKAVATTYSSSSARSTVFRYWQELDGGIFHFRCSTFGGATHITYSADIYNKPGVVGFGPMLPPTYADYRFSFVGYI